MPHVHLRADKEVLARLDEFQRARGFASRSAAIRAVIREAPARTAGPPAPGALPDRAELLRLLSEKARDGNLAAVRVLLDELRRDAAGDAAADPSSPVIDELAKRRDRSSAP